MRRSEAASGPAGAHINVLLGFNLMWKEVFPGFPSLILKSLETSTFSGPIQSVNANTLAKPSLNFATMRVHNVGLNELERRLIP